jgi:hypothetical protein
MEVELRSDQWDEPPPPCPQCAKEEIDLDFRPIALGGSTKARAIKYAEKIAEEDYHVADMQLDGHGGKPKVRYKEPKILKELGEKAAKEAGRARVSHGAAHWTQNQEALHAALSAGREARMAQGGHTGLDILQKNLADGTQADLIKNSRRLSAKIW